MTPAFAEQLPIDSVLPELTAALEDGRNAVLVAEPGAGKTTRVPIALLTAPWRGDGRIIVLEPRRLAARAAARRMAETLGEQVGRTVGYRVRMESKVSAATRIEVVTEGVFTRMIAADPELNGVAAVLFDEFHERSLDGDLGLALALDVQGALRNELRLVAMSATIDASAVAGMMDDGAAVIVSTGRSFPVETRYLGREPGSRLEDAASAAVRKALAEETGSILVFLPGQGEIRRTTERLEGRLPPDVVIAPLYGALDAKAQDLAIRPAAPGTRKIVLATAIAQTSLTIEGVRVVIDCGLARMPRYEPGTGLTRLETVRVSRAAADQRRGRAGRMEPGVCYRLWDQPQTAALAAQDRPEILEADLTGFALDLAAWGVTDPAALRFLDPPPAGAWAEAVSLLKALDALDADGRITEIGRQLTALPLDPRLAHMILAAGSNGAGLLAAEVAVLLSDPGLGGRSTDLRDRLAELRRGGPRAAEARALARRWLAIAEVQAGDAGPEDAGTVLALAYPERVAQARDGRGSFRLANGRGGLLDEADALAREPFLAVAELQGTAARGRIALAAPLDKAAIERLFASHITETTEVSIETSGAVRAKRVRRYSALVLAEHPVADPDPEAVADAVTSLVRKTGVGRLAWSKAQQALRARITYLHRMLGPDWPDLSDEALTETADDWLRPYLFGKTKLSEIDADCLGAALSDLVPHGKAAKADRLLPSHFDAPSGSRAPIDYDRAEGPVLSIRVQELFGLDRHPCVAGGKVPLTLELLSPAHRPIQITKDLPGFWRGSWAEVKSAMKGRYPKHPWPDDPLAAAPTRRAKPRR